MKPINHKLLLALWGISLITMTFVDYVIGGKAEFINAWSVWQRMVGATPSAGDSLLYNHIGALGEFIAVLLMNFVFSVCLLGIFYFVQKKRSNNL